MRILKIVAGIFLLASQVMVLAMATDKDTIIADMKIILNTAGGGAVGSGLANGAGRKATANIATDLDEYVFWRYIQCVAAGRVLHTKQTQEIIPILYSITWNTSNIANNAEIEGVIHTVFRGAALGNSSFSGPITADLTPPFDTAPQTAKQQELINAFIDGECRLLRDQIYTKYIQDNATTYDNIYKTNAENYLKAKSQLLWDLLATKNSAAFIQTMYSNLKIPTVKEVAFIMKNIFITRDQISAAINTEYDKLVFFEYLAHIAVAYICFPLQPDEKKKIIINNLLNQIKFGSSIAEITEIKNKIYGLTPTTSNKTYPDILSVSTLIPEAVNIDALQTELIRQFAQDQTHEWGGAKLRNELFITYISTNRPTFTKIDTGLPTYAANAENYLKEQSPLLGKLLEEKGDIKLNARLFATLKNAKYPGVVPTSILNSTQLDIKKEFLNRLANYAKNQKYSFLKPISDIELYLIRAKQWISQKDTDWQEIYANNPKDAQIVLDNITPSDNEVRITITDNSKPSYWSSYMGTTTIHDIDSLQLPSEFYKKRDEFYENYLNGTTSLGVGTKLEPENIAAEDDKTEYITQASDALKEEYPYLWYHLAKFKAANLTDSELEKGILPIEQKVIGVIKEVNATLEKLHPKKIMLLKQIALENLKQNILPQTAKMLLERQLSYEGTTPEKLKARLEKLKIPALDPELTNIINRSIDRINNMTSLEGIEVVEKELKKEEESKQIKFRNDINVLTKKIIALAAERKKALEEFVINKLREEGQENAAKINWTAQITAAQHFLNDRLTKEGINQIITLQEEVVKFYDNVASKSASLTQEALKKEFAKSLDKISKQTTGILLAGKSTEDALVAAQIIKLHKDKDPRDYLNDFTKVTGPELQAIYKELATQGVDKLTENIKAYKAKIDSAINKLSANRDSYIRSFIQKNVTTEGMSIEDIDWNDELLAKEATEFVAPSLMAKYKGKQQNMPAVYTNEINEFISSTNHPFITKEDLRETTFKEELDLLQEIKRGVSAQELEDVAKEMSSNIIYKVLQWNPFSTKKAEGKKKIETKQAKKELQKTELKEEEDKKLKEEEEEEEDYVAYKKPETIVKKKTTTGKKNKKANQKEQEETIIPKDFFGDEEFELETELPTPKKKKLKKQPLKKQTQKKQQTPKKEIKEPVQNKTEEPQKPTITDEEITELKKLNYKAFVSGESFDKARHNELLGKYYDMYKNTSTDMSKFVLKP